MTTPDAALSRGSIDHDWFESFFTGLFLDFWRACTPAEQTRVEVDFLERTLALPRGARVLDVACGLGRHSLELAARGHRPTGVDASREALERARAEAASRGLAARFVWRDLRRLEVGDPFAGDPLDGPFDGAFALGNSFGYVEPGATAGYLAGVARALKPGARFVFDSGYVAEALLTHFTPHEEHRIGDFLFLEENRYLLAESCVETTYTLVRGEERVTRKGWQWLFTLREVVALLSRAGFAVEALLRSTAGEPFRIGDEYLLVVARKE